MAGLVHCVLKRVLLAHLETTTATVCPPVCLWMMTTVATALLDGVENTVRKVIELSDY